MDEPQLGHFVWKHGTVGWYGTIRPQLGQMQLPGGTLDLKPPAPLPPRKRLPTPLLPLPCPLPNLNGIVISYRITMLLLDSNLIIKLLILWLCFKFFFIK